MAETIFIQRSWIGRRLYRLQGETLAISYASFGRNVTEEHPLHTLSPDYQRIGQRLTALIVVPFVACTLCLGLTVLLLLQDLMPQAFATYPALFGIIFLLLSLRGVRRFDCFVFSDQSNQPRFTLIRETNQAAEFDPFLDKLLDRIEQVKSGLPTAEDTSIASTPPVSAVNLPSADDSDEAPPGIPRWSLALGAGATATILPWLAKVAPPIDDLLIPTVFLASTLSTWWCLKSFLEKERLRYGALIGLGLAWGPWFLY